MKKNLKEGDIDLKPFLFKIKNKWYYYVISLFITTALAFFYTRTAREVYSFRATVLLKGENTGSKQAQELLKLLEVKDRGVNVDDEIGLLTSLEMVKKAVERLDFSVAYYAVENNLLNTFGELVVREVYTASPYKIVLDPAAPQIIGQKIYVELLSKDKYRIHLKAKDVKVFDLQNHRVVKELPELEINKTLSTDEPYKDEYLTFKLVLNPNAAEALESKGKYFFIINDLNKVTREYQGKLLARPLARDSKIIELITEGEVPEKENKFLNQLVAVFIEQDLNKKNQIGEKTLSFIDNQLSEVADTLGKAKSALSRFQSDKRLIDPGLQSNNVFQRLESLNTQRDGYRLARKYYTNILNYLQTDRDASEVIAPSVSGVENTTLATLLTELAQLNRQKVGINVTAKKDNPVLQVLDSKIANLKSQLIESVNENIRSTDLALQEVNQRIGQLEGNIAQLPDKQRELLDLQGKSEYNDKTYNFLLEKRTEAAIALATNVSDKEVVDEAKMLGSGPTSPKTKQIFFIAILLGLIIPTILIILADYIDDTIKTKEDLEATTSIPFLGVVSNADKNTKIALIDKPKSAIAESFRSLRVSLQYLAVGMDKKVIGVTSSISGEGKTFTSVNLSVELALSGKRTLLIEADLRRPSASKYLGLSNKAGLSSYLIKANTLTEVIQHTKIKNLDVITAGPIPPNPIELLDSVEMEELLSMMSQAYDYIILDIPPIGFVSEYFILLKHIDASLYIVRHKYSSKELLDQINDLYNTKKINHIYLVLNDVKYSSTYQFGYKSKGAKYYV